MTNIQPLDALSRMITNLSELADYTERRARTNPELYEKIRIHQPGLSPSEVQRLSAALPLLPETYLTTISAVNIDGSVIGYFMLRPGPTKSLGLVDDLIQANDEELSPFSKYCHKDRAYLVAWCEADPIAIVHTDGLFKRHQVLTYSDRYINAAPELLADNFEQFLLLAGNLDEIRAKFMDAQNPVAATAEFVSRLEQIAPSTDTAAIWKEIAEVILD